MTIKYKLGFTIDSETLFSIMSKFLPIQDLSVEEVVERPLEDRVNAKMKALGHALQAKQLKPVRKQPPHPRARRISGYPVNLYGGVNNIIMSSLADGKPHTLVDSHANIVAAGYSKSGLYSRVQRLVKHGYIVRVRSGYYQLTPKGKIAWDARPMPPRQFEDRAS
jgi:hypothetical protein